MSLSFKNQKYHFSNLTSNTMNIFIIGVGLIGGSFAKDIKRLRPESKMYGIDTDPVHEEEALSLGIIDARYSYDELGIADMVIVMVPVDAMVIELPKILDACLLYTSPSPRD